MKKSLRTSYWFIASIFKRYAAIIIGSLVVGIVFTINAPKIIALIPKSQTIYIGRAGSYNLAQLPLDIQEQISGGLTKVSETGEAQPDIALSWNIQESGKFYEFQLDPSKTWQDGQPITTQDLEIAIPDVEVEKKSDQTIIFRLKDPYSPFPIVLSQPQFKKVNYTKNFIQKRTKIIGTKDTTITDIKTSGGTITQLTLKSPTETKIYRFYPTEEDVVTAFMLGHIDRIEQISNPGKLNGWKTAKMVELNYTDRYVALFFNTQDSNLSNKSVRQALAYAIPKTDYQRRAISPINPQSWAYNPQVKPYLFDPNQARELLAKASGEAGEAVSITITTTQTFIVEAEKIAKSWEDIGVSTQIKIVNFPDTNEYQALLIGQYIPKDPDQYTYWHSTQNTNFTKYNNPRIDKLLEDGRKTIDQDERTLIYQDFQRFLIEDSPAVFLHYLDAFNIERE